MCSESCGLRTGTGPEIYLKQEWKSVRADTRDNKPRLGKSVIPNIAIELSQFQRILEHRADVEQMLLQMNPEEKEIACDDQEGDDRIPPRFMLVDDRITPDKAEGDTQNSATNSY